MKPQLKTGCKAYYDAFLFGVIPCVVVSVGERVQVRLTASRGQFDTYQRGEVIETTLSMVFPREAYHFRGYKGHVSAYDIIWDGVNQ